MNHSQYDSISSQRPSSRPHPIINIIQSQIATSDKPKLNAKVIEMFDRCFLLLAFFSGITALSHPNSVRSLLPDLVSNNNDVFSRRDLFLRVFTTILANTASSQTIFVRSAEAMYENSPESASAIVNLQSGVSYQDIREGDGALVEEGKRVNIQWVLKRSNGYTIDSSANNDGIPFIFVVGNTRGDIKEPRAIRGLDLGIRGMRVGGIRRIVIPPSLAYVDGVEDGKPGPVPQGFGPKQRIRRVMELLREVPGESIVLDVKATRIQ